MELENFTNVEIPGNRMASKGDSTLNMQEQPNSIFDHPPDEPNDSSSQPQEPLPTAKADDGVVQSANIRKETPREATSGEYTMNELASTPQDPNANRSDYSAPPAGSGKDVTDGDKTE